LYGSSVFNTTAPLRAPADNLSGGTDNSLDLLWGADAIAGFIKRTKRQTWHMLERGLLPARKHGKLWTASKADLRAHFTNGHAATAPVSEATTTAAPAPVEPSETTSQTRKQVTEKRGRRER